MIRYISISFLLLLIAACGTQNALTETEVEVKEAPQWVNQRPISGAYYIGISASSKVREPLEYASVAKKNALSDLASEISVEVQGSSFLNTLEVNKHFHEEFVSNITTSTREKIEGYEIAGTWETEDEYWVYYRLSKAKHAAIKKEKKDKALSAANDLYLKGRDAAMTGNMGNAIDMHIRALLEMKEYWADVNEWVVDGRTVYLDNEIYSNLNNLAANIQIQPSASSLTLSHANGYESSIDVLVHHKGNPLRNIPVAYVYDKGKYMKPREVMTTEEGKVTIRVSDVNIDNSDNRLSIEVDIQKVVDPNLEKRFVRPLLQALKNERREIPIHVELPSAYIESTELDLGQASESQLLSSSIQNALLKKGIKFTSDSEAADYTIRVSASTTRGGTSQGLHVAYLEMSIAVVDNQNGSEVYRQAMNNIKGLQLNFAAASNDAYKRGGKKIETEIIDELINTIF